MAELNIKVNVDGVGKLDQLEGKLLSIDKDVNKVEKSASSLGKTIGATASVAAVGALAAQYIKLADTMTGMESQLKLVTSSTQELAAAQDELFKIAQKTRQGYEETTKTYANFAVAMSQMGKSQKDVLRVTETINKAIAISGGTAQQAASATMQLGQAFASGALRGDELNSILENSKGLAQAIATGMGVPIGKLRELGSEGKITADILANALEKSASSVDAKFAQITPTVSQSITQMENSLLRLVGTADQAMNGSGGLSEVFSYFSEAIDNNRREIVESAQDALRATQVLGTGVIQVGTTVYQGLVAIPTALLTAIDTASQLMENAINNMIELAEDGSNKIQSLYGGDKIKLGRVDIDTNISKGLLDHYNSIVAVQENAIATQGKLFQEIWDDTTVLQKNLGVSGKGGPRAPGSGAQLTKEQIKAAKKLAEDLAQARRDALQDNADREADLYLSVYQAEQDAIQTNHDMAAQLAIDLYNAEQDGIQAKYDLQAQLAKEFFDMTVSEADKVNEKYLELFNANEGLFSDEQLQVFFNKWNEALEKTRDSYNSIIDEIDDLGPSSKDWTNGLKGQAKNLANVLNATLDLANAQKKIDKQRDKIQKSNLTSAEKEIALDKLKTVELESQMAGYSNLAGAMASAFEQGSDGAIAFTALQSALGIASSWTAIAQAWALPFPANIPAVAMVTSAVMPIIQQLGGSSKGGQSIPAVNANAGTVLGGSVDEFGRNSEVTKSITNIVDMMDEVHASEYPQLIEINRAVTKMANSIEGAVTNIFRSGALDTSGISLGGKDSPFAFKPSETFIGKLTSKIPIAGDFINNIADFFGGLGGSVFGGKRTTDMPFSGLAFGAGTLGEKAGGNIGAQAYATIREHTSGGMFGKSKERVYDLYSELDASAERSIALIYESFSSQMDKINEGLGTTFQDVIDSYQFAASKIDLKGLSGQEATDKLTEYFSAEGDKMVNAIFGQTLGIYQKLGEGLLETATRVVVQKEIALQQLGDIGINQVFNNAIAVTDSLVQMAGGLTEFVDANRDYYDKFFTDSEKMANSQKHLAETFEVLGISMPESVTQFRKLVESLDLSTEAGQEAYTSLMQVSGAFFEVKDAIEELRKASDTNINGFIESLMTPFEFAVKLANDLGVPVAKTVDELIALFNTLAYDADGLTDAELDLVNANKQLLEDTTQYEEQIKDLNITLDETKTALGFLNSSFEKILTTVNSLRGASKTADETIGEFYSHLAEAKDAFDKKDYEAYTKAVDSMQKASSVFLDSKNFQTAEEMKFAQYLAANQMEALGDLTKTEIDYLAEIEKNTKDTVDKLVESMNKLGETLNSTLLAGIRKPDSSAQKKYEQWVTDPKTGIATWTSTGGAVATATTGGDFDISTTNGGTISKTEAIDYVTTALSDNNPLAVYQGALATGISANSLDALMGWESGTSNTWAVLNGLKPFMSGGYTGDVATDAIAGIVHGKEYVVNAQTTKDLGLNNSAGVFAELLDEIKSLRALTTTVAASSVKSLSTQRAMLGEMTA